MAQINIAGTLHNTEEIQGDALNSHVVAHADEILDSTKEKKQSEVNAEVDQALDTLQTQITEETSNREQSETALETEFQQELATKQDVIQDLSTIRSEAAEGAAALEKVENIESLIPGQTSISNQLADKSYVNNQVATNTANFVGTFDTLVELEFVQNPTNNDYGFVIETDALGNEYYNRYKYVAGTGWRFEYKLESTSFTSEQWAAIQSGITSGKVAKLDNLPASFKTINGQSIEGIGNIEVGGAVESVNGKTGVVVLDAEDVGAASAEDLQDVVDDVATNTQDIENLQAAYAGLTQNDIIPLTSLPASGVANTIYRIAGTNSYTDYMWNGTEFIPMATYDNAIDNVPMKGSNNLVTSGGVFDYTSGVVPFVATSNNLAAAVAEVPAEERCVGKIVEFTDVNGNPQKYKFMGKYYTDEDWNSMASATTFGAWLDLNNADKYRVYYFRLTPTLEGTIKGSIDTNGNIGAGTDDISDYIEIPENGVSISGGFLKRYVLYDENKTKLSSAVLYGEKTFSTTDGKFVRVAGPINWKIGTKKGASGVTYPRNQHVEVVENYEDLIDYNNADGWAGNFSPFIRLKKGETIRICNRDGNPITHFIAYQQYDIDYNTSGSVTSAQNSFTTTIDGYVKIGSTVEAIKARTIAAGYRLSKSRSMTTAKKRLLVVGDSTSILTYSSELETDVAQGYPYFTAIEGEREISVTNQAVSGNTCSQQFTKLQDRDLSVYDAITIFVGTNNYGYGTTAAGFKTELKTMVEYIIAQKPSIKIGLLTLLHRASAWDSTTNTEVANASGSLLSQFSQAIREVGQEYSIPVLDIWNECQCNFNYETYVANYSSTAINPAGDGLHPTNEAHKLFIYPLYREFIKKLFAE